MLDPFSVRSFLSVLSFWMINDFASSSLYFPESLAISTASCNLPLFTKSPMYRNVDSLYFKFLNLCLGGEMNVSEPPCPKTPIAFSISQFRKN